MLKEIFKSAEKGKASKERELLNAELVEIQEIADLIFRRLEEKIQTVKALEAAIDKKIAALEELNRNVESALKASSKIDRRHEVLELKKKGLKIDEIGGILDMPAGEVELILNLN